MRLRYGQPTVLKSSHIAALKSVELVYNGRELGKLRKFYDHVDTHYKALSVLGINSESYAVAIMPDLMKKLPRDIVISIKRAKDVHHEWSMAEFFEVFWQELMLRGVHDSHEGEREVPRQVNRGKSFHISNKRCAYCLEEHESKDCKKVTEIDERKKIVSKYKRCLYMLEKGSPSEGLQRQERM